MYISLLRDAFIEPLVLKLLKWHRLFLTGADGCCRKIGCALFQLDDDVVRRSLGFWSKSLYEREKNNSARERECLAVVWVVQML